MRGKVWILNVWASWCVACREEHPLLVEFAKKRVVPLYGLNYKDTREDATRLAGALRQPLRRVALRRRRPRRHRLRRLRRARDLRHRRNGVIRMKHIGPLTPDVLANKIEPLLKKLDA